MCPRRPIQTHTRSWTRTTQIHTHVRTHTQNMPPLSLALTHRKYPHPRLLSTLTPLRVLSLYSETSPPTPPSTYTLTHTYPHARTYTSTGPSGPSSRTSCSQCPRYPLLCLCVCVCVCTCVCMSLLLMCATLSPMLPTSQVTTFTRNTQPVFIVAPSHVDGEMDEAVVGVCVRVCVCMCVCSHGVRRHVCVCVCKRVY